MAAVSQPGSRAGLITALVIFVILFFIAAIFAVVKGIDDKEKEKALGELRKKYQEVISEQEMTGPEYGTIKDLRILAENRSRSVFDILYSQRNALTTKIAGQAIGAAEALNIASQVVQASNERLKAAQVTMPGTSLVGALNVLTEAVVSKQQQSGQLSAQLAASNEEMKGQIETYKAELDQHRKSLEAAKGETAGAQQQSAAYKQSKDEQVAKLEKDLVDGVEKARKAEESDKALVSVKDADIKKLQSEVRSLVAKLDRYRPQNISDSIIRQPDGRIVQVARNNVVYINLGQGSQITAGMTFEIYDRELGIPKTGTSVAEELPKGKGSLEVTRVGSGSSECRVVRATPGLQIVEGDLIANLIYDANTKLKFKIYGDFDMDQNGVATAQEAEIVKRLVAQWGGTLSVAVAMDTDFVIMGKEPTIPQYTAEQLKDDAGAQYAVEKATKALAEYEDVRTKALDMHVPVLNQNRFLYLIGFYDQAKK